MRAPSCAHFAARLGCDRAAHPMPVRPLPTRAPWLRLLRQPRLRMPGAPDGPPVTAHADWALAVLSLLAAWLMGSKRPAAWPVTLIVNLAFAWYFATLGKPGLVALEAAFVAVNLRGWRNWHRTPGPEHPLSGPVRPTERLTPPGARQRTPTPQTATHGAIHGEAR